MNLDLIKGKIENLHAVDILKTISKDLNFKIIFTTSFGIEDQVISDLIFKNNFRI